MTDSPPEERSSQSPVEYGSKHQEQKEDGPAEGGLTENDYPKQIQLTLLMCGACLAAFLVGLDQTIVTTAIPQITNDFESPSDVGWYGSAYLLSSCALQPIYGQLYKQFNVRFTYFVALAAFLIGSLICAVAPVSVAFIVGRALAGVGCAGVLTGNLNMVALSAPLEKRPIYISMLGTLYGIGLVCGPIIGGALTSDVSWRWCFWINLPIGAVTVFCTMVFFRSRRKDDAGLNFWEKIGALDLIGGCLMIADVVMLLLALQWGGVTFRWRDATIIGLLVGSGVGATAFILWQHLRGTRALLPLRIIGERTVASTIASAFFQSGATFVPIFYLPYWFQVVGGVSPVTSGVDMIPWMAANFLAATFISIIVTKTGYFNPPLLVGLAIGAVGSGLFTTLYDNKSVAKWVIFEILTGAGLGAARQQYFLAVQAVLQPKDVPIGIALVLFSQNLAGAIFVSVGNTIIRNRLASGLVQLHVINVDGASLLSAGATAIRKLVPPAQLPSLIQLFSHALHDVFVLAIPLTLLALACAGPMKWKNLKKKQIDADKA